MLAYVANNLFPPETREHASLMQKNIYIYCGEPHFSAACVLTALTLRSGQIVKQNDTFTENTNILYFNCLEKILRTFKTY